MSISALFRIASRYLLLGIIVIIVISLLFSVGYFLVYKKILKGKKTLKISQLAILSLLFIYIVVVLGATLGMRTPGFGIRDEGSMNLYLFSSYREAWNSFSPLDWRNLILNILMFVPLGFLLPLLFNKCKTWWVTYLVGFISTLFLETVQYITRMGVFELDDIFNNVLGCIIGYGLVMICLSIFRKKSAKVKKSMSGIIALQLPLIATIVAFSTIFILYSRQELGNLSAAYCFKEDMSKVNVNSDVKFSTSEEKGYVYKTVIGSKADTLNLANDIFSVINKTVDESLNDVYDDTIIYHSEDNTASVWVDFLGLTTNYSDYNSMQLTDVHGLSYEEIRALLSKFSIDLPTTAKFTENQNNGYEITVSMYDDGNSILDGTLTCAVSKGNIVSNFRNNILTFSKYKEFDLISEQEAYNMILDGKFKTYFYAENSNIDITGVTIEYITDSKGYYQPLYKFTIKDSEAYILIPALKL